MKFFAVVRGRKPGYYIDWSECDEQVKGFCGCLFKGFRTEEGAKEYLRKHGFYERKKRKTGKKRKKRKIIIDDDMSEDENDDNNENNENIEEVEDAPPKKKRKLGNIIHIFTDGGCISNGTSHTKAGIGVYFGKDDSRNISRKLFGKQTNNTAELTAIIEALKIVLRETDEVVIHTDSEYCINGIFGCWKMKKNLELFEEIKYLLSKRESKTIFDKVKGHSGVDDGNYWADQLATQACVE